VIFFYLSNIDYLLTWKVLIFGFLSGFIYQSLYLKLGPRLQQKVQSMDSISVPALHSVNSDYFKKPLNSVP